MPGSADAPVTLRVLGTLEADAAGVSVRLGGPTQRAVLARILVGGRGAGLGRTARRGRVGRAGEATATPCTRSCRGCAGCSGRDAHPAAPRRLRPRPRPGRTSTPTRSSPRSTTGAARWPAAPTPTPPPCSRPRWPAGRGERGYYGMADVADMPVVDAEADRLDELRVAAAEALADAHVRLGRGGEDVDRLGELVARYPLRESVAARQVMRALRGGPPGRRARRLRALPSGLGRRSSASTRPRRCAACTRPCWPSRRWAR